MILLYICNCANYLIDPMIPVYQTGSASTEFTQVNNLEELDKLKKSTTDKCVALLFWAEWHEPCHHLKNMMGEMAKVH